MFKIQEVNLVVKNELLDGKSFRITDKCKN